MCINRDCIVFTVHGNGSLKVRHITGITIFILPAWIINISKHTVTAVKVMELLSPFGLFQINPRIIPAKLSLVGFPFFSGENNTVVLVIIQHMGQADITLGSGSPNIHGHTGNGIIP